VVHTGISEAANEPAADAPVCMLKAA